MLTSSLKNLFTRLIIQLHFQKTCQGSVPSSERSCLLLHKVPLTQISYTVTYILLRGVFLGTKLNHRSKIVAPAEPRGHVPSRGCRAFQPSNPPSCPLPVSSQKESRNEVTFTEFETKTFKLQSTKR